MIRPGSSLSKMKQQHHSLSQTTVKKQKESKIPTKEEFIKLRDFQGAITLLEHEKMLNKDNVKIQLWLAYCYFHNGDYDKATDIYTDLIKRGNYDLNYHTYKACCYYALCKYKEAFDEAQKGPMNELNTRIKLHCAFKLGNGSAVIDNHTNLSKTSRQDQLCLAALNYLKNEYEDAIDIYKKMYMDKKYDALNVYMSMCYYKLDYFELAQEFLNHYLAVHKDSIIANNLKSAIEYNLTGNYKAALSYLSSLQEQCKHKNIIEENDILKHNMAVYDYSDSTGTNKLKVFSNLVDIIPEAKLNLIIYYLRNEQVNQAYNLIKDLHANSTKEVILKGVTHYLMAMNNDRNQEHLNKAQGYLQSIGASASEIDTIEGRQSMASCFNINGFFHEEIDYLESIEPYMKDDDDYNWNYGVALAAYQKFKEAEDVLLRVKREKYRNDEIYLSWLCRCYIMNGKPDDVWNLYISIDNHVIALNILNLIANEFYRMGYFFYSFKAFMFLEKFTPSLENSNGKIASAVGLFYQLVAGKVSYDKVQEVIVHLNDTTVSLQQAEEIKHIISVIKTWGKENGYNFTESSPYENPY